MPQISTRGFLILLEVTLGFEDQPKNALAAKTPAVGTLNTIV